MGKTSNLLIFIFSRRRLTMEADVLDTMAGGGGGTGGVRLHHIHHVNPDHHGSGFLAMNCMRQRGQLCDVRLHCAGATEAIPAHKVVLASCSAYFHAMFNCKCITHSLTFYLREEYNNVINFKSITLLIYFSIA